MSSKNANAIELMFKDLKSKVSFEEYSKISKAHNFCYFKFGSIKEAREAINLYEKLMKRYYTPS